MIHSCNENDANTDEYMDIYKEMSEFPKNSVELLEKFSIETLKLKLYKYPKYYLI